MLLHLNSTDYNYYQNLTVNQNGMFRVFAFSSDDERQIRIELVKVREKFPDAWILKLAK